jgi:NAD(P)-dependent dehydrogenase (short-subunit alcohol dehydrogenase family)
MQAARCRPRAPNFRTNAFASGVTPPGTPSIHPERVDCGPVASTRGPGEVFDGKRAYFDRVSSSNPAGRIGTIQDVAQAVLFAMTNTFMTGTMLKIDGGEPLT